jgi:hypothetical protein
MTWLAVIVVLSVVPSTRAVVPLVTALADAEFVPFSYVVDDVSLIVTFSPADVNSPKPDVDTLLTVPIDPPVAGPDRAFDPPPVAPEDVDCAVVVEELVAAAELDEPPQAESPIAGTSSPAVAATDAVSLCLRSLFWRVMSAFFRFIVSRYWDSGRRQIVHGPPSCFRVRQCNLEEVLSGSRTRTYGQARELAPSSGEAGRETPTCRTGFGPAYSS